MASFWDLLPASLLGQRSASGWPYADALDPYSPFVGAGQSTGSKAAAPNLDSTSATSAPPQTRPLTFWDLLPAPQGQSFVPMMPAPRQPDPWVTPVIRPRPTTLGRDIALSSSNGATDPGFLGLALGRATSGGEQPLATLQPPSIGDVPGVGAVPTGAPGIPPSFSAGALGAAAQDRESFLAPWSASHGLLDYPVIGPVAGLSEYLMRGAAKNWREGNQGRSDEEAKAPNRYYLPRPGERSPASRYSAAPVGDMLGSMIAAPFVATHEMMQPPLRPPPDSEVDDSGRIWVKSRPDSATYDVPWQQADPDAAHAYYADQQRRAEFAPRMALSLIGGGANFASRDAVGMAGGRLVRPPAKAANIARKLENLDGGTSASAAVRADAAGALPIARTVPTGQNHHLISRKIHRELEDHDLLSGLYRYRDPRFETQAIDTEAHRGYQKWHRELDDEIATYIRENPLMSQERFESYLRGRYAQPDLLARFPNGL